MEYPSLVDGLSTLLLGMGPTQSSGPEPEWIRNVFRIEKEKPYISSYDWQSIITVVEGRKQNNFLVKSG